MNKNKTLEEGNDASLLYTRELYKKKLQRRSSANKIREYESSLDSGYIYSIDHLSELPSQDRLKATPSNISFNEEPSTRIYNKTSMYERKHSDKI